MQEAVASRDVGEARACLRSLAVPFFHHEFVKQALLTVMENSVAAAPLLELLKSLADSSDVSPLQMQKVSNVTLYCPDCSTPHLLFMSSHAWACPL